ncbi:MAG: hypothetical protein PUK40_06945 [Actinomycetaceae bacterium]|nr:hypothetical protein [Arcanobacterium sp.]MDD7505657.1 hypothetical protein [Actinomycetaceae bacterium]MDY6143442.1 hypothetical protein [Arcanobacterium sp.]
MVQQVEVQAERSGKWWALSIPIEGKLRHTQGRTLKEAEEMARDLLELYAQEYAQPALATAQIVIKVVGEAGEAAEAVEKARLAADEAAINARETQQKAVRDLRSRGLTMADIGRLLGLTKGRISQLAR